MTQFDILIEYNNQGDILGYYGSDYTPNPNSKYIVASSSDIERLDYCKVLNGMLTEDDVMLNEKVYRSARAEVFKAFDIYKTNLVYGIIQETPEQHSQILEWYNQCLSLNGYAIDNPPLCIANYLRGC